jgi:hypothetical protein
LYALIALQMGIGIFDAARTGALRTRSHARLACIRASPATWA